MYIRNLNQALNHGLFLKNIHRTITFDQHDWLKPYVEMNSKLRTETKNEFEKDFFKLMNNSVFGKTMESQRKYRDIKLETTGRRGNDLASEPNYYTTNYFTRNFLAIEMKKTQVTMIKPVYLVYRN